MEPSFGVRDDLHHSAHSRCDAWKPNEHRLCEREAKGFSFRNECECVGGAQEIARTFHKSRENHAVRDAKAQRKRLQIGLKRSIATQEQDDGLLGSRGCVYQVMKPLAGPAEHPANARHHKTFRWDSKPFPGLVRGK